VKVGLSDVLVLTSITLLLSLVFVRIEVAGALLAVLLLFSYVYLMGFTGKEYAIGRMLDPSFFNSPHAILRARNSLLSISNTFTVSYYILVATGLVALFVYAYFKTFT